MLNDTLVSLPFLSEMFVKRNKAVVGSRNEAFQLRGGGCDMRDTIFLFFGYNASKDALSRVM